MGAVCLIVIGIALSMYFKPHKDFGASKPDLVVRADQLLMDFTKNETEANRKYVEGDETVMVEGIVDDVQTNPDTTVTIILKDNLMPGSISCTLVPLESTKMLQIKKGISVRIKGQCTGLQELIDPQVIMIRCVIAV